MEGPLRSTRTSLTAGGLARHGDQLTILGFVDSGEIEDRWGILETNLLDGYARELATEILYQDGRDPAAGWQTLDMAVLQRRFAEGVRDDQ